MNQVNQEAPKKPTALIAVAIAVAVGIAGGIAYKVLTPSNKDTSSSDSTPSSFKSDVPGQPSQNDQKASESATNTPPSAPDLSVDAAGLSKTSVTLTTTHGPIKIKFYASDAPNTVKRMIELVQQGFYNGLTFHRVVANFVIQGGDPQGDGQGGSGQRLKAEYSQARKHLEGTVAMARGQDPDSADSQFYITMAPQPHLDGAYTIIGQVVEGMDVVRKIQVGDKMIQVRID